MNKKRYEIIKKNLENKIIIVDLEKGTAYRTRGRNKNQNIGCLCKKTNYIVVGVTWESVNIQVRLHEIIAVAGNLDIIDKTVDHVDGNKLNNSINNLEAVTLKENSIRQHKLGLKNSKGESNSMSKLTEKDVINIKTIIKNKTMAHNKIAKLYNVTPSTISEINNNRNWAYVTI